MAVESPPLWAWPVVVGVTIATKFIYRWHATKQLSKQSQEGKINVRIKLNPMIDHW